MPPALERRSARAISATVLAGFAAICVGLYWQRGWSVWLLVATPAISLLVVIASSALYELALLIVVQLRLRRRGVRCIVVHSESPLWKDHIADRWLPRLGRAAIGLNWSQRGRWPASLAVAMFHRFCGTEQFNPAVIVLRGIRRPYVFRFFHAFHEAKRGRTAFLQSLEDEMFRVIR
jgi:hypothetical protein